VAARPLIVSSPTYQTPASELFDLLERPAWWARAECREHPLRLFFPSRENRGALCQARAVCHLCPVLDECREWAMAQEDLHGIFGGLSAEQRQGSTVHLPLVDRAMGSACGPGWAITQHPA